MRNILIADDHPAIRNGVKLILKNEFSEVAFGEAASGKEALEMLKQKEWDVIILDMDMPDGNGLDVLKKLKEQQCKVPVLMFSMHPEEEIAIRALKVGASGYLSKDTASEELANAIRVILSGKKFITPAVAERLAMQLENPASKAPHEFLSAREYQTFILFAEGKTVTQIAKELKLGVPTISTFRLRILEKMGMKTTAEMVRYAIRNNLA